jgi:formylglycine-generating enzyme required for sulfatase activity
MSLRIFLLPPLLLLLGHATAPAQAVTNLRPVQRPGTNLVDIDYDITGTTAPLHISLQISTDDGLTYPIPATSVSGAAGYHITPAANLRLTWDAGKDWGGKYSTTIRYKILADDNPPPVGFARIPAGEFLMGDQSSPRVGDADELPVHTVNVSEFFMGKYEVTKEEWDLVRAWAYSNGYSGLTQGSGKAANHPVHTVNWHSIIKWCNARSEMEKLTPCYTVSGTLYKTGTSDAVVCNWNASGYRLPSEAEWEKAARGGLIGQIFPWGNTINHNRANFSNVGGESYQSGTEGYHPIYGTGATPYSSPVGSFAPNGYGLYDMEGNMSECCWDWYGAYAAAPQTNPHGAESGTRRVVKSGRWHARAHNCRVSDRYDGFLPSDTWYGLGFRLARSATP